MKVEWEGQHPDEGSIHAWLDGELDASEAALVDEHVRGCTECRARVAEARGLIAGASRVVGQLDAAPARLIQPAPTPTLDHSGSLWRLMRVTPARASIAAVLLVALGITLTRTRVARDSEVMPVVAMSPPADAEVATAIAAPKEQDEVAKKDGLLDSAISRKIAAEQPARTFERAPGVSIPAPDAPMVASATPDTNAALRVAAGRASIRASADSAPPAADRARAGFSAPARADAAEVNYRVLGKVAGVVGSSTAGKCYLIESTVPGAQWGPATLPMVLAFDSTGAQARVLTTSGADTEVRATQTALTGDSLVLAMRRIGYAGSLTLDAIGDARGGVMRSGQPMMRLESVVVTSEDARRRDLNRPPAAPAPVAPQSGAGAATAANKSAAQARENASSPGTAVSITANVVSCNAR